MSITKLLNNNLITALLFFFITLSIYSLSYRGEGAHFNYFVYLADAFLHGRIDVTNVPSWLNEVVTFAGRSYVVYPPMPAFILIPFVIAFGLQFPQPYLSILLAAINVALAFLVFQKIFQKKEISFLSTTLYAFGTIQWYHAEVGSAWYIAHIVTLFFLWLMLYECFTRKRFWLIGLLIGAAYLSRLPAILAVIFVVSFFGKDLFLFRHHARLSSFKNLTLLIAGLIPFIIFNFWYNFARFHTFADVGYVLLPIQQEPWYQYGLFSIKYLPIHLIELFTALPAFSSTPPFIVPSLNVLALPFVTPALFIIYSTPWRSRLTLSCLATALGMSLPGLMHGSNGFTQFGYRFSLDYHPFLLLLIGAALSRGIRWWMIGLIVLSIMVNAWGVMMISILQKWTM
jgi:hypothetical protein